MTGRYSVLFSSSRFCPLTFVEQKIHMLSLISCHFFTRVTEQEVYHIKKEITNETKSD